MECRPDPVVELQSSVIDNQSSDPKLPSMDLYNESYIYPRENATYDEQVPFDLHGGNLLVASHLHMEVATESSVPSMHHSQSSSPLSGEFESSTEVKLYLNKCNGAEACFGQESDIFGPSNGYYLNVDTSSHQENISSCNATSSFADHATSISGQAALVYSPKDTCILSNNININNNNNPLRGNSLDPSSLLFLSQSQVSLDSQIETHQQPQQLQQQEEPHAQKPSSSHQAGYPEVDGQVPSYSSSSSSPLVCIDASSSTLSTEYATSESLNNFSQLTTDDQSTPHLSSLFLDFVPDDTSESVESLSTLLNTPDNISPSLLNTSSILAAPSSSSTASSLPSDDNQPGSPPGHGILVTQESFSESEFQSNSNNDNNCFNHVNKSLNTSGVVTLTTLTNSSTTASTVDLLNRRSQSQLTSHTPLAPVVVTSNATQVKASTVEVNLLFEQAKCYKCKLCNFICLDSSIIVDHIETMHKSNLIFICNNSNNNNSDNNNNNNNNNFTDEPLLSSSIHNQSAIDGTCKSSQSGEETISNYPYTTTSTNPQYRHSSESTNIHEMSSSRSMKNCRESLVHTSPASGNGTGNGNANASLSTDPQQIYICSSCRTHLTSIEQVHIHVNSCPISQLVLPIQSQEQQHPQATHSLLVSATASPIMTFATVNVAPNVIGNTGAVNHHSNLVTQMAPKLAPKVKISSGENLNLHLKHEELTNATGPTNSTRNNTLSLDNCELNFESNTNTIPSISKLQDYQGKGKLLNNVNHSNGKSKNRKDAGAFACTKKKCTIRFASEANLKIHLECHSKHDESKHDQSNSNNSSGNGHGFTCYICCTFSSLDWASMAKHLWRCHKVDIELHKCNQCEYRHYSLSYLENNHAKIHSSEKNYSCETCSKKFKNSKQLLNHERRHENKPEMSLVLKASVAEITDATSFDKNGRSFTCDICSRSFIDARALRVHRNVAHKITRAYTCNACGRTSASRAALKTHMRSHTGEKPFKCQECEYSTSDHNSLRRHKMRHSGERPYKCPFCTYACIQSSTFKQHLRNKHPDESDGVVVFTCSICSLKTVSEELFKTHQKEHEIDLLGSHFIFGLRRCNKREAMSNGNNNYSTFGVNGPSGTFKSDGESCSSSISSVTLSPSTPSPNNGSPSIFVPPSDVTQHPSPILSTASDE